jgi:hypothetical protein
MRTAARKPWIATFARGWTWVAVAVGAVVAATSLRRPA